MQVLRAFLTPPGYIKTLSTIIGYVSEEKLAELIQQMKAEIAGAKRFAAEGRWDRVVVLAGQKKARGTRNVAVKAVVTEKPKTKAIRKSPK